MLVKLVQGESPTAHCLTLGELKLYFSYETVIAFRTRFVEMIVSENLWGTTTGKHINAVTPLNHTRLPRQEFEEKLKEALMSIAITVGG